MRASAPLLSEALDDVGVEVSPLEGVGTKAKHTVRIIDVYDDRFTLLCLPVTFSRTKVKMSLCKLEASNVKGQLVVNGWTVGLMLV